jgi:ankyrin repeat protein
MYDRSRVLELFCGEPFFDFEAPDDDGNTPLHHAMGSHACSRILLFDVQVRPDPLNFYGETPLHLLCETGIESILFALRLRAKKDGGMSIDFNRRTRIGSSPLELAILEKASDLFIRVLVREGTNVNLDAQLMEETRGDGGTPIMRAAWMGRKRTIEILLAASPDRNASLRMKDRSGLTVVDYAVDQGHHELATWLREELRKATNGEN